MRWLILMATLLVVAIIPFRGEPAELRIGSKKFTESVVVGELLRHLADSTGVHAVHQQELGGTRLVYEALRTGEIDVYPEYSGTIREEILADVKVADDAQMRAELLKRGITLSPPLGFNNTYALGMKQSVANQLGISTISDLTRHPELQLGFNHEFLDRADGWPGLRTQYGLPHEDVRGMDHDLMYRQLDAGAIDVAVVYTTDAQIAQYDLQILDDDRQYFPKYEAVLLYRTELAERLPSVVEAFQRLESRIPEPKMIHMNKQATLDHLPETQVAADFLEREFQVSTVVEKLTWKTRVVKHTLEHLDLVRRSLVAAVICAIPLGILAFKRPRIGQIVLGTVGIIQTIPALALLVVLIKPMHELGLASLGAGSATAVVALFLYSLLPIVRNTHAGLQNVPASLRESASALGLPPFSQLWLVELPLASRTILAGIKTAAVINVGFATLGALIGAGGFGQPILTGIRLDSTALILEGAVPAACMALAVQGLFELIERRFVPEGLRLQSETV